MGEINSVISAYTMYRHLQQYCSHPSNYNPDIYNLGQLFNVSRMSNAGKKMYVQVIYFQAGPTPFICQTISPILNR